MTERTKSSVAPTFRTSAALEFEGRWCACSADASAVLMLGRPKLQGKGLGIMQP